MGTNYYQLSHEERDKIALLRAQSWSFKSIGEALGRHGSTISREYIRHRDEVNVYLASQAHKSAKESKVSAASGRSKCHAFEQDIHDLLQLGWTPAQIAGRLSLQRKGFHLCYETIYRYLYRFHIDWTQLLPRKHAPRWHKYMGKAFSKRPMIPNRISILERPEQINDHSEFGHWEGDSIVCSQSKIALNVLVERQSQYVSIRRVDRGPKKTEAAMIDSLGRFKASARRSVTLDNGIEFKQHEAVKKALHLETYFCQPYHSWEKGLVEQVNGLIRRFLPKKTDLSQVKTKQIRWIEYLLNSRPRKRLNWVTPAEFFAKKCRMKLTHGALAV